VIWWQMPPMMGFPQPGPPGQYMGGRPPPPRPPASRPPSDTPSASGPSPGPPAFLPGTNEACATCSMLCIVTHHSSAQTIGFSMWHSASVHNDPMSRFCIWLLQEIILVSGAPGGLLGINYHLSGLCEDCVVGSSVCRSSSVSLPTLPPGRAALSSWAGPTRPAPAYVAHAFRCALSAAVPLQPFLSDMLNAKHRHPLQPCVISDQVS
jgi:hypothetical protein